MSRGGRRVAAIVLLAGGISVLPTSGETASKQVSVKNYVAR